MTRQKLKIVSVEDKVSQAGKRYWTVNGEFNGFDDELRTDLLNIMGKDFSVEVDISESKDGKYKNIRKVNPMLDENPGEMVGVAKYPMGVKEQFLKQEQREQIKEMKTASTMDTQTSIMRQCAFKGAIELVCSGKIELKELGTYTELGYKCISEPIKL